MKTFKGRALYSKDTFNLRNIFLGLLALNLVAALILYISLPSFGSQPQVQDILLDTTQNESDPYTFEDPFVAHHLLTLLDEFEPVDPKYYNFIPGAGNFSRLAYMNMHLDDQYCDKHRHIFVNDPKAIFEGRNYLTDYAATDPVRTTSFPGILDDLQPDLSSVRWAKDKKTRDTWIDPRQNYYYVYSDLHAFQHLGANIGCMTQAYNRIPGDGYLSRKDLLSESIFNYAEKYKAQPQCFSYEKAFPRTWVLKIESQCKDFFAHLESPEHTRLKQLNNIVYIKKIGAGAHNGRGVLVLDDEGEKDISLLYDKGAKCGQEKHNTIIQYFIPNPLLLEGRKFHFRMYLLVASMKPIIAYYHDGYVKLSLEKYDSNSDNKFGQISNTQASAEEIQQGALVNGMNETELQYFQRRDFDQFQDYLLKNGIVKDPQWLDNYLRPELKKTMIHLVRMVQENLLKRSAIFEIFGVDFMMDANLKLWLMEVNGSPSLAYTHPESAAFVKKLLQELFEIEMGLTRSRAKRIIKYINELTRAKAYKVGVNGELEVENLQEIREGFKKITLNSFEKEFEPSTDNGFRMIINEHLSGQERYMGLIDEECI